MVFFLQSALGDKMVKSGMLPEGKDEMMMMTYLDWYQNTLRPTVKQYMRYVYASNKASNKWEI